MTYATMLPAEAQAQQTFRALLAALSYPGRPQPLPAAGLAAFAQIGAALLDLETSYYCAETNLAAALAATGARATPPTTARYQFYPVVQPEDLDAIAAAPRGTYSFPDESATFLVGCAIGSGTRFDLRGPGINGTLPLQLDGLPAAFWELRTQAIRYPLGWDLFLVASDYVVGLPRTTLVEVR